MSAEKQLDPICVSESPLCCSEENGLNSISPFQVNSNFKHWGVWPPWPLQQQEVCSASGANSRCSCIKKHPGSATAWRAVKAGPGLGIRKAHPCHRGLSTQRGKGCQARSPGRGPSLSGSLPTPLGCWAVTPVYIREPLTSLGGKTSCSQGESEGIHRAPTSPIYE